MKLTPKQLQQIQAIQKLFPLGDINTPNSSGQTPLGYAISHEMTPKVVEYLLQMGADPKEFIGEQLSPPIRKVLQEYIQKQYSEEGSESVYDQDEDGGSSVHSIYMDVDFDDIPMLFHDDDNEEDQKKYLHFLDVRVKLLQQVCQNKKSHCDQALRQKLNGLYILLKVAHILFQLRRLHTIKNYHFPLTFDDLDQLELPSIQELLSSDKQTFEDQVEKQILCNITEDRIELIHDRLNQLKQDPDVITIKKSKNRDVMFRKSNVNKIIEHIILKEQQFFSNQDISNIKKSDVISKIISDESYDIDFKIKNLYIIFCKSGKRFFRFFTHMPLDLALEILKKDRWHLMKMLLEDEDTPVKGEMLSRIKEGYGSFDRFLISMFDTPHIQELIKISLGSISEEELNIPFVLETARSQKKQKIIECILGYLRRLSDEDKFTHASSIIRQYLETPQISKDIQEFMLKYDKIFIYTFTIDPSLFYTFLQKCILDNQQARHWLVALSKSERFFALLKIFYKEVKSREDIGKSFMRLLVQTIREKLLSSFTAQQIQQLQQFQQSVKDQQQQKTSAEKKRAQQQTELRQQLQQARSLVRQIPFEDDSKHEQFVQIVLGQLQSEEKKVFRKTLRAFGSSWGNFTNEFNTLIWEKENFGKPRVNTDQLRAKLLKSFIHCFNEFLDEGSLTNIFNKRFTKKIIEPFLFKTEGNRQGDIGLLRELFQGGFLNVLRAGLIRTFILERIVTQQTKQSFEPYMKTAAALPKRISHVPRGKIVDLFGQRLYSQDQDQIRADEPSTTGGTGQSSVALYNIRICSWNVKFSEKEKRERYDARLKKFLDYMKTIFEIICLQEVPLDSGENVLEILGKEWTISIQSIIKDTHTQKRTVTVICYKHALFELKKLEKIVAKQYIDDGSQMMAGGSLGIRGGSSLIAGAAGGAGGARGASQVRRSGSLGVRGGSSLIAGAAGGAGGAGGARGAPRVGAAGRSSHGDIIHAFKPSSKIRGDATQGAKKNIQFIVLKSKNNPHMYYMISNVHFIAHATDNEKIMSCCENLALLELHFQEIMGHMISTTPFLQDKMRFMHIIVGDFNMRADLIRQCIPESSGNMTRILFPGSDRDDPPRIDHCIIQYPTKHIQELKCEVEAGDNLGSDHDSLDIYIDYILMKKRTI
jgi:hypothetical protein